MVSPWDRGPATRGIELFVKEPLIQQRAADVRSHAQPRLMGQAGESFGIFHAGPLGLMPAPL